MKFIKILLLFVFFLLLGFTVIYYYLYENPKTKSINITNLLTGSKFSLLSPPRNSLRGEIKNISGEVLWQSRVAELPIKVNTLLYIQQGEVLETGIDGIVDINFLEAAKLKVSPDTKVEIIQTLPANLVFGQSKGKVVYEKLSGIPVSIRVSPVLIEVLGNVEVVIDSESGMYEITGLSKIAYNNSLNQTQLIEVPIGKTLVFNSNTLKGVLK